MRYIKSMMIAMAVFMPMFWSCDVLDTLSKEDDTLTLYWEISDEKCVRFENGDEIIDYYLAVGMEGDQSYAKKCEEVGFCVMDAEGEILYQVEMNKDFDYGTAGWLSLPTYLLNIDHEERLAYAQDFSICAYSIKENKRTVMHVSEPIYFIYNHKPSLSYKDASYVGTVTDPLDNERQISYFDVEFEVDGALWIQGIQTELTEDLINEHEYIDLVSDGRYAYKPYYWWYDNSVEHAMYARLDLSDASYIYSENHLDVSAYSVRVDRLGSPVPSSTASRSNAKTGAGGSGSVKLLEQE
jgi:hypothetical protein